MKDKDEQQDCGKCCVFVADLLWCQQSISIFTQQPWETLFSIISLLLCSPISSFNCAHNIKILVWWFVFVFWHAISHPFCYYFPCWWPFVARITVRIWEEYLSSFVLKIMKYQKLDQVMKNLIYGTTSTW